MAIFPINESFKKLPCYITFSNFYIALKQNVTCYCYQIMCKSYSMLWFQLLIILGGQE